MDMLREAIKRAVSFKATKTAVAEELGTNPQVLWRWETGKKSMPDDKLVKLAEMTGADPVKLLGQYHYERWQQMGKAQSGIAIVGSVAAVLTVAASASLTSLGHLGSLIGNLLAVTPDTLRIMHRGSIRQAIISPA